ncbi:hypothetical protein PILCRDRAFT_11894 [Piloderma croceum F 1598]|uniref:Uncharacterized protein n=1 Tax=Piloderma croceum (strain F 1598) TaxID=765440 RepID=A0A0C3EYQ7_PILCF|nr:hypothetical protein PILCRDRAFT_11894 [Piloderma croceum F 1598]
MPNRPNCWTCNDENLGSLFHELVVLTTLTPELAHPEYLLHDKGPVPYPQPCSQQITNSVFPVNNHLAAASSFSENGTDAGSNDTIIIDPGGPVKPKTTTDSKSGPPLAILGFSWTDMVCSILNVHGLQDCYLLSPISGPPFRLTCKGMVGGVKNAPTVCKLSALKAKNNNNTIQITVALKDLKGYKNHKRLALLLCDYHMFDPILSIILFASILYFLKPTIPKLNKDRTTLEHLVPSAIRPTRSTATTSNYPFTLSIIFFSINVVLTLPRTPLRILQLLQLTLSVEFTFQAPPIGHRNLLFKTTSHFRVYRMEQKENSTNHQILQQTLQNPPSPSANSIVEQYNRSDNATVQPQTVYCTPTPQINGYHTGLASSSSQQSF